ncbi:MAG: MFS transporter [Pseudomonadota bacterium]
MVLFARFLAFSVIGTAMLLPLLVLPAMVGVLVDEAGLSESSAGWLAAFGALGGAAVSFAMALRMHRLAPRRIAVIAISIAILTDVLSALNAGPTTLFFTLRLIAGIATTAAYVLAIASFARFDNYERGYGLFVTLQFIVSGFGLYILPVYSAELGAQGMFLLFALADGAALASAFLLPSAVPQKQSAPESRGELRVLLSVAVIAAVIGFCMFEMANTAEFTYVERFGVSIGLSDDAIGAVLLIASLIGIPGAFTIVVVGDRFGVVTPLSIGVGLAIAGLSTFIVSKSYTTYFIGSCFLGFSWAFCLPYIQAFLASLDRDGSALAAGSTASTLGAAIGPAVAAAVLGEGRYAAVFGVSILFFFVTIALFAVSRASTARPKSAARSTAEVTL